MRLLTTLFVTFRAIALRPTLNVSATLAKLESISALIIIVSNRRTIRSHLSGFYPIGKTISCEKQNPKSKDQRPENRKQRQRHETFYREISLVQ
jgi:hypothetical protein